MRRFLASLSADGAGRLARQLLESGDYPKAATALLLERWGELEALDALGLLEELGIKNDYFELNLYVGWIKRDLCAAFDHLEGSRAERTGGDSLSQIDHVGPKRDAIWRTLTEREPERALALLLGHSGGAGDEIELARNIVTTRDRDEVIGSLPDDSDWAGIAENLIERGFAPARKILMTPGIYILPGSIPGDGNPQDRKTIILEEGGGFQLFERWVPEDPKAAIEWHLNHGWTMDDSSGVERPSVSSFLPHSLGGERALKVISWLDEQLQGGESQELAERIVVGARSYVQDSWMGLYARLPSQEDRFQVMKEAIKPHDGYIGGQVVYVSFVGTDVVTEYLPRFNLTPDQEAEIREGIEFFEDRE